MDHGRIVERGSHDELITSGGLYSAFAEEQRVESELEALGSTEVEPEVEARTA
jgi:hypothetical protein